MTNSKKITYPYLPQKRSIKYVGNENSYMAAARDYARLHSIDDDTPTATIIVKNGNIIGQGANGSDYHKKNGCIRAKLKIPTGTRYELCEGCSYRNHSEVRAIQDGQAHGYNLQGADLYLWGHWWCCEPCWKEINDARINQVFLLKDSEILFNDDDPRNILGRQFK